MSLPIAQLGQPILRQVAELVPPEEIPTAAFQTFLHEMLTTLQEHKGAGLAAPQVFVGRRFFVAAILPPEREGETRRPEVFINPRLTPLSLEAVYGWEGCLSFPELLVLVPRPKAVRIDYLNAEGQARTLELTGFPARVVQHEYDHLDGILSLERTPSTRYIVKASEIETVLKMMNDE